MTLFTLLLLCGCATMNRSECQTADWRMIGLEDGSQGRTLAYIGEHRKACAEYRISPDLVQYESGYNQGLQQYCTYSKGYQIGKQGSGYNNVCTAGLETDFLLGYQRGRNIHAVTQEIKRTNSSIRSTFKHLEELDAELLHKEALLIAPETSVPERILLLVEIKEVRDEIDDLELEIEMLEEHKSVKLDERSMMKQKYQAGPG
jgi:hypothetical protein